LLLVGDMFQAALNVVVPESAPGLSLPVFDPPVLGFSQTACEVVSASHHPATAGNR
jgi:hypothetical protein